METSGGISASGGSSSGIQASLGGRYATALFDLARDGKSIDAISGSLAALRQALAESDDFRRLTTSPLVSRDDAGRTVAAVAQTMNLDPTTTSFLGVLARNGRLSQLAPIIRVFSDLAARHRGETSADVVSAHPLDDDQIAALKAKLRERLGREVAVDLSVDPAILGGLVVTVGSTRIDGSLRTKLNTLAHAMKG